MAFPPMVLLSTKSASRWGEEADHLGLVQRFGKALWGARYAVSVLDWCPQAPT